MHGMAGSAALILLTLNVTVSWLDGLIYIGVFGVGSITGMGLLSIVVAVPLRRSVLYTNWAHEGLQVVIGGISILLGARILYVQGVAFLS